MGEGGGVTPLVGENGISPVRSWSDRIGKLVGGVRAWGFALSEMPEGLLEGDAAPDLGPDGLAPPADLKLTLGAADVLRSCRPGAHPGLTRPPTPG